MLFNIVINDLEENLNSSVIKTADNTNIGGVVNNEADRSLIQSSMDHFIRWAQANNMCFSVAQCRCSHLDTKHVGHTYRMGDSILGSKWGGEPGSAEHDLTM